MLSFLISAYLTVLTVLFILDVKKGLSDATRRHPGVGNGSLVLWSAFKQLLMGFVHAQRERAKVAYATCTWERCDSVVSGAGKAIAMK